MSTSETRNQINPAPSPVIACVLSGEDLVMQAERWKRLRAEAGIERIETSEGFRLTFNDDVGVDEQLHALVAVENGCCSWAHWEVSRVDGDLVMDARSSGDGVAALHGMFLEVTPRRAHL